MTPIAVSILASSDLYSVHMGDSTAQDLLLQRFLININFDSAYVIFPDLSQIEQNDTRKTSNYREIYGLISREKERICS